MAEIGVGMLGYAFMGKAHSHAFRELAYLAWPRALVPRLVGIAGRNEQAVGGGAQRYGHDHAATPRRRPVADERNGVFDNRRPNSPHPGPPDAPAPAGQPARRAQAPRG